MGQEIVYCCRCQNRIVGADFDKGDAYRVGDKSACGKCAMLMLPTVPFAEQQQILDRRSEPSTRNRTRSRRRC